MCSFFLAGGKLEDQKIIFLGAGEAGTGIGKLISLALHKRCGIPFEDAVKACFYIDSKGLVCKSRTDLQHHKALFAHDVPFQPDLLSAVNAIKYDDLHSSRSRQATNLFAGPNKLSSVFGGTDTAWN